jgi:hypothetical protein
MRRILRKIAENAIDQIGDTTTLATHVVEALVKGNNSLSPHSADPPSSLVGRGRGNNSWASVFETQLEYDMNPQTAY